MFRIAIIKSGPKAKDNNIVIIDLDVYCVTNCLKATQVFIIFGKNISYQAKKKQWPRLIHKL